MMHRYLFTLICLVAAFKWNPGETKVRSEGLGKIAQSVRSLSGPEISLKGPEPLSATDGRPKKTISRRPNQGSNLGSKRKMSGKARKMKYRTPEQLELARKRAILRLQRYLRRVRARQFRAQMQRNLNLTKLRKLRQIQARLESDKRKLQSKLGKTRSAFNKDQRLYLSLTKQINLLSSVKSANVKAARGILRRAASSATRRKFMSRDMRSINRGSLLIKNSKPGAAKNSLGIDSPRTSALKPMPTKTQPHSTMPSTRVDL